MHMVTPADHRGLKATLKPMFDRTRRFPLVRDLDHDKVLAEARRRFPTRVRELHDLSPSGRTPGYFTDYIQSNLPLVRVPPAGTWGVGGSPLQELAEVGEPDVDELVRRYLAALGPATVRDAQAWSGLTNLREVFERLELEELGEGYFDLPGAPRPPADTPAPVRFLPRFDNVLIGYADRGRFGDVVVGKPTILVDGVVAGTWRSDSPSGGRRRALRDWLAAG